MIIILDDSLSDRKKYQNVDYLWDEKYFDILKIYETIKPTDIGQIISAISNSKLVCNHKTLQLYDNNNNALIDKENLTLRENLLTKVSIMGVLRIEFSRGLESNYDSNKIDKELFYYNLKQLLDNYIDNNQIEIKILFWGANYKIAERLSQVQKMLMEIRNSPVDDFLNNEIIIQGIKSLYITESPEIIISSWKLKGFSKNNIIDEINNYL
jgi:hypothetical protein